MYDNQALSYRVLGVLSIMLTIALVFFILTWLTYPKSKAQNDVPHAHSKDTVPISATNVVTLQDMHEKESAPQAEENVPEAAEDGIIRQYLNDTK